MTSVASRPRARSPRPGTVVAALGLAGFIAVGLPDGALGVAWPSIRAEFGRSLGSLGWLLVGWTIGALIGSALSGPIASRIGMGRLLFWASTCAALGFVASGVSPWWIGVVLASTVLGAGCGTLDAGINAHVATTGDLRSLNLLHAAYGLGATLAPLLLTLVLHVGGSWRIAYGLLAAYCVVLVVGYACTRHRWVTPARDESDESDGEPLQRPRLEAVRGLAGVTLLAFFVYVGVEATAGRWAYTLFTEGRGMPDGAAGLWAGGFWLALTASRFLTVFSRLGAERLIDLGIAGMLIGSALLWWAPTSGVAGVGLLVVGLGAAPIFPAFVHLTPDRFGAQGASHAIGYQVAMAGAAAAIVPGVVGVLAGHVGLGVIAPSMVIGSLVLVVLHRLLAAAVARTPVRSAG